MFHWAEEDGATGAIVDQIINITKNQDLNDLEVIEDIYVIITTAHEKGII